MGRVAHRHRHVLIGLLAGAIASTSIDAWAQGAPPEASATPDKDEASKNEPVAIIGPVLTMSTGKSPELRPVQPTDPVATRAREVAAALKDSAQDLGLELDLTAQLTEDGARDLDLIKRAAQGVWVISPRLESTGGDSYVLRIFAVPPKSATMLVRAEKVDGPHVSARAIVMLRDFVQMKLGAPPVPTTAENAEPRPEDEKARSRGRPILAASTTIFGLFGAYSLYKSSGNDDPRLLYPLLALGSGIGLGASLLAADEWDVTPASAWTVAGGTWWGVFSGVEIATGRNVQPSDDRFGWGFAGGLAGTTLAVGALAFTHFDEGDAAIVHSGAAFGTFTGGIIEGIFCGRVGGCYDDSAGNRILRDTPSTGLGYGAAAGLLGGGLLATLIETTAQRVFFIDLGAGLGALGGASVASPLVFKEKTEGKQRGFLVAVLGGTAIGGTIAWLLTREKPAPPTAQGPTTSSVMPLAGIIGTSYSPTGASLPVFGVGATGAF